jgi:hypothetical protein
LCFFFLRRPRCAENNGSIYRWKLGHLTAILGEVFSCKLNHHQPPRRLRNAGLFPPPTDALARLPDFLVRSPQRAASGGMSSLMLRKTITRVICFPNQPRTKDSVGVPVDLDQQWEWEQCVQAIADAMHMQDVLSDQTRVYTATGFEIDTVSSCIQGETLHVAWAGDEFFESGQHDDDDDDDVAQQPVRSNIGSGNSGGGGGTQATSSAGGAGGGPSRKQTDLRRGSELDHETAQTRLVMKFIIVGSQFVGKSCLLAQFANKQFPLAMSPTLGVDYNSSIIKIKNTLVKIQVWDTAGQEEHRAITRAYFRDSAAALVVYDVTNQQSFDSLGSWIEVRRR